MALDPARLHPDQLADLLRRSGAPDILSADIVADIKAGCPTNSDGTLHAIHYTAWLHQQRHHPPKATESNESRDAADDASSAYARHKERARARQAKQSKSGRDIGDIPPVADPKRRAACKRNFRKFCETYCPERFTMNWSDDHLEVLKFMARVVLGLILFALAMPRGSGKTTIIEVAIIWAVLYGHRRFVVVVGADQDAAIEIIDSIKDELEQNDRLAADFPEVCYPIRCLDGITQRARGQLCNGKPTRMKWSKKDLVLPTIPGSKASGVIIRARGILGRIRGMKKRLSDGSNQRPDMFLLDDPQTDESAKSFDMTDQRMKVINKAVLGLGGRKKKIAGVALTTTIEQDDVSDQLTDRKKNPDWHGKRYKMVYAFPENEKLWSKYAEIRAEGLRKEDGGKAANEFYKANRTEMDKGAIVAWPEAVLEGDISAIQTAMNLRFRDEPSFFAEYQCDPMPPVTDIGDMPTADAVAEKVSTIARGTVPLACTNLVAMVDVHDKALYWTVVAFGSRFTGQVIDYGTWPEQDTRYFSLRKVRRTLGRMKPGAGRSAKILNGLNQLAGGPRGLLERKFPTEAGTEMQIELMFVDGAWENDTVAQFIRESRYSSRLLMSYGQTIRAANLPMDQWKLHHSDKLGHRYLLRHDPHRKVRYGRYDRNYWMTQVFKGLAIKHGDLGALTLYGAKSAHHRLLSEHITNITSVLETANGRSIEHYIDPKTRDIHWLDCLAGSYAAASIRGIRFDEQAPAKRRRRGGRVQYLG